MGLSHSLERGHGMPRTIRDRVQQRMLAFLWEIKKRVALQLPVYPVAPARVSRGKRALFTVTGGRAGRRNISKIIHRFGHEDYDYWIFAFDETAFDEPVFRRCRIIREPGILCYFHKKYMMPSAVAGYDYILPWVDDIDIGDFSPGDFFDIFERNQLEVAQPALTRTSLYSHLITLRQPGVGRLTDYTEIMAQVFTREAWSRFWWLLEADRNFWGWGYSELMKPFCGYQKTGIIDRQAVTHLHKSSWKTDARTEKEQLLVAHAALECSRYTVEGLMV